jgi:hypothetical protein
MSDPTGDDHVRNGLDHLQAAALELIAATRAFLDVAEDLVREPGVAADFVRTAAGMVAALRGDSTPPSDDPPEPGVRRIRLS